MYLPASFWTRLLARLIDEALLLIVNLCLILIVASISLSLTDEGLSNSLNSIGSCVFESNSSLQECVDDLSDNAKEALFLLSIIPAIVSVGYYFAGPLSVWQATLGKKLLGLKVVSQEGAPVSILQALTREIFFTLFKLSGPLIYIYPGVFETFNNLLLFIVLFDVFRILFRVNKAALHDSLSYSYVVLKDKIKLKLDKNQKVI
jgi:uncharacterized RDD family membrane protein YckC